MKRDGYDPNLIHGCHNRTVVIDAHLGERENKQVNVVEAHGLRNVHLYEGEEWIAIRDAVGDLTKKFLCLNEVYPDGFMIPRRFIGENIIHLPTVKTHIFTTTTGAMKNAFGGLLNERRHWTHPVIHETLVDLLMIQKKIHRGVFAVMDGTFAGDGPGPRCMVPYAKNVILASADQVAIDAVAAKLMGMDPLSIKFIRLAHDLGLGCGDPRDIEIVGDAEAARENWNFVGPFKKMTFASRMQHKIYWGPLKGPIEWSLKTVLAPWSYMASVIYHDSFWYPFIAKTQMQQVLASDWGRLFRNWETVHVRRARVPRSGRRRARAAADGPEGARHLDGHPVDVREGSPRVLQPQAQGRHELRSPCTHSPCSATAAPSRRSSSTRTRTARTSRSLKATGVAGGVGAAGPSVRRGAAAPPPRRCDGGRSRRGAGTATPTGRRAWRSTSCSAGTSSPGARTSTAP